MIAASASDLKALPYQLQHDPATQHAHHSRSSSVSIYREVSSSGDGPHHEYPFPPPVSTGIDEMARTLTWLKYDRATDIDDTMTQELTDSRRLKVKGIRMAEENG